MIVFNNFFAYWIILIEVKRCEDDLQVASSSTIDIYRCLDDLLKYIPNKFKNI